MGRNQSGWAPYSEHHELFIVGQQTSPEVHALRTFLDRNGAPFRLIDLDSPLAQFLSGGEVQSGIDWPVCILPDGTLLENPSWLELANGMGLHTRPAADEYDLAIIGAGPAGLTAAVYAASGGLRTVVVEREAPGGQAGTTSRIENYPGFPDGTSGMELMGRALRQARRFGAEIILVNEVTAFNTRASVPFELFLLDGTLLRCHTMIIATGASYRLLEAPGIASLNGRGVYYGTAISEAAAYAGKDVFVVGGGNSAGQTAMHLSGYARSVRVLVRGASLRQSMSQYLIDQLEEVDNIEIWTRTQVTRANGNGVLESLDLDREGREMTAPADALFILIGQRPATDWAEGVLLRDRRGFLITGSALMDDEESGKFCWILPRAPLPLETNAPGVFAAGDVRRGAVNRVAWAAGEAAMAVQHVHQYLGKFLERDLASMRELPEVEESSGRVQPRNQP